MDTQSHTGIHTRTSYTHTDILYTHTHGDILYHTHTDILYTHTHTQGHTERVAAGEKMSSSATSSTTSASSRERWEEGGERAE